MLKSAKTLDAWNALFSRREEIDFGIQAANQRHADFGSDEAIPVGLTCYTRVEVIDAVSGEAKKVVKTCPFWAANHEAPDFSYGYCARLKAGDWQDDGTIHLWDLTKECGVNESDPDDNDAS